MVGISLAQNQSDNNDIYIESWTTNPKIREGVLNFDLDSGRREQTAIVHDYWSHSYKLIFSRIPAGNEAYSLEYWVVQLKPILSAENRKEKLGDDLLNEERPGTGGHNFPVPVGVLFPREAPKNGLEKVESILTGSFYPISARRVIKVQNFFVFIKVNSFR